MSRRQTVSGLVASWASFGARARTAQASTLAFQEVASAQDETHHVAPGYQAQVLLRWGDPVTPGAPPFDPARASPRAQAAQFGANCDFTAFVPLPPGSSASDHGLLVVNHEYTDTRLMFPGLAADGAEPSLRQIDTELAAHGMSIVEIVREGGTWRVVADSFYNRRVTTLATVALLQGPAGGHPRLATQADPTGTRVLGTLANCGGGVTPWDTVLSGEENFDLYFAGDPAATSEARNHERLRLGKVNLHPRWAYYVRRFDMGFEPNEPNRFGWVVEVDPFDPSAAPVKRTALGRFKHEGANVVVNGDGRVVVYMGDDEEDEYIYRFVSAKPFDPLDRFANLDLLDEGTLHVARLEGDGTLAWLPLVQGRGPLDAANGFASPADVMIETRRAADLVGATPMDRPEGIARNPVNGRVYAMLTRGAAQGAYEHAGGPFGHVVEIAPGDGDHAAETATWDVFLVGGDGSNAEVGASYGAGVGPEGWIANPDNCAFDPAGRLWIATDGMAGSMNRADGVFATDVDGEGRAATRRFLSVPEGAEPAGPCFTPDGTTLFLSIQHPGEGSNYDDPSTRWPDFDPALPPRAAVLAIAKDDGGPIGS